MNMFKDAARKKAEDAAKQIASDHGRQTALAELASDVAEQLMQYLIEHPVLQEVQVGTHNNVVNLQKTQTSRSLQILCGGPDLFSLVEGRPEFQRHVNSGMPRPVTSNPLDKAQMIEEVLHWLA